MPYVAPRPAHLPRPSLAVAGLMNLPPDSRASGCGLSGDIERACPVQREREVGEDRDGLKVERESPGRPVMETSHDKAPSQNRPEPVPGHPLQQAGPVPGECPAGQ